MFYGSGPADLADLADWAGARPGIGSRSESPANHPSVSVQPSTVVSRPRRSAQ